MPELLRYPAVTLTYDVIPSEVCGGVYVADEQRFVPVTPHETYQSNGRNKVALWEYKTVKDDGTPGDTRACLLRTYPGSGTHTWHIKPETANPAGYYEQYQTVSGTGYMLLEHLGRDEQGLYTKAIGALILPRPNDVTVLPEAAFSLVQPWQNAGNLDVLATYPAAPFDPSYEERI